MRKPRIEDFDPHAVARTPEAINMAGIVPLQTKPAGNSSPAIIVHENAPATMTARPPDSTPSYRHDSTMARPPDGMTAKKQVSVTSLLHEKATQKTTIRLPSDLLNQLEETLYHIRRHHQRRLSMNAIFVAALVSFCADYEQHGTESALYKLLTQESHHDSTTA